MNMIYLASPYTKHPKHIRQLFFEVLCDITAQMFNRGEYVFTPIVYAHPVASRHNLPPEWDYWKEYDESFISICSSLWVLKFPGWEESTGVQAEIKIAEGLGLPVRYVELSEFGFDVDYVLKHTSEEYIKLEQAVDDFSVGMKWKLDCQRVLGLSGWDNPDFDAGIKRKLKVATESSSCKSGNDVTLSIWIGV